MSVFHGSDREMRTSLQKLTFSAFITVFQIFVLLDIWAHEGHTSVSMPKNGSSSHDVPTLFEPDPQSFRVWICPLPGDTHNS